MKTFVTTLLAVISFLHLSYTVKAQEHKIALNSGTISFNEVNNLSIEGYTGNEVVITYSGRSEPIPERAKGLKPVNSMGIEDNTGIGLSATKTGDVVELQQVLRQNHEGVYQVKVPANVKVKVSFVGETGQPIKLKNLQSEVEVSARYNSITAENLSGPTLINTMYGTITASFASVQAKNPVSIVSVYNDVDVALPATTKANLTLTSQYGNIYTDMDLAYQKKAEASKGEPVRPDPTIKGTLNGGGTELVLKSDYKNVYLRKK